MTRLLLALALLFPVAPTMPPAPRTVAPRAVRRTQAHTWVATWYGKALHGHLTSWHYGGRPGTRFDRHGLTCAHRDLPFGSRIRVARGGQAVTVTVTDRGPEAWTGADVDLSEGAAAVLGMRSLGRAVVQAEVLP